MIKITKFTGKKETLIKLMEELQDYLVQIDPLKIRRRMLEFGEIYTNNLFQKIKTHKGIMFVAYDENIPIGMVAGIIEEYTKNDEIENVPLKTARVLELIVNEKYRGKKLGLLLMKAIEEYFHQIECDIVYVKVFEPNKKARNLYKKLGYQDRMIDMVKNFHNFT